MKSSHELTIPPGKRVVKTDPIKESLFKRYNQDFQTSHGVVAKNYVDMAQMNVCENYPVLIYAKPALQDVPPGTILGSWQYSIPGSARFILDSGAELAEGTLPGDVARAWIDDVYDLPLRRRKDQMQPSFKVPNMAKRGKWGECSYVDISSAYLQILRFGWNVEYVPGRYIGAEPFPVPSEVAASKLCYSCAVSMSNTRVSNIQIRGKEGVFTRQSINLYSNPCLFNLAQDTLNAIGSEVISVLSDNCVYANTDGFIIRSPFEHAAIDIIESWGFQARVKKTGLCEVFGTSSYSIGSGSTQRHDPYAQDRCSQLMDRPARLWLKQRWIRWRGKLSETEQRDNGTGQGPIGGQPSLAQI